MDMTVGTRIIEARKARNMSRPELARLSGVPYPTLAGLENGDQQSSTAIPALAQVLGVSAVWLSTGRGHPLSLNPSSESVPQANPPTSGGIPSQTVQLSPATLHEALTLLVHDEGHAGAYSLRARSDRLYDLITRVVADGGRLTKEHNKEFEAEVRARAEGVKSGSVAKRRIGKPAGKPRGK